MPAWKMQGKYSLPAQYGVYICSSLRVLAKWGDVAEELESCSNGVGDGFVEGGNFLKMAASGNYYERNADPN